MSFSATTISRGVGTPARSRRRDVIFPDAGRELLQVEVDRILGAARCGDRRVPTDDCLPAGRLASELGALIPVKEAFQRGNSVGRHAARPLLIAADRRHLRDNRADPPIGRAKDKHVAPRITGALDADTAWIDCRQGFEKGDGAPPIRDLAPWIDIVTEGAVARPEIPVVMQEHHEPGLRKGPGEPL